MWAVTEQDFEGTWARLKRVRAFLQMLSKQNSKITLNVTAGDEEFWMPLGSTEDFLAIGKTRYKYLIDNLKQHLIELLEELQENGYLYSDDCKERDELKTKELMSAEEMMRRLRIAQHHLVAVTRMTGANSRIIMRKDVYDRMMMELSETGKGAIDIREETGFNIISE